MENKIVKIFDDIESLNLYAAEKIIELSKQAIKQKDYFSVALAGGSTPKSLYRLLTTEEFNARIEWEKVFFFFGDERNVLPNDDESNFKMAHENLFAPLEIREENIFRWHTELKNAKEIAVEYQSKIKKFFDAKTDLKNSASDSDFPRFDLILLGMGDDGHTASLFPRTPALNEKKCFAVANRVEKLNTDRLTLTYPIINHAVNVIFLVKGADKAEVLHNVLEGDFQPENLPSQNVKPGDGNLFWLVEREAAAFLKDYS